MSSLFGIFLVVPTGTTIDDEHLLELGDRGQREVDRKGEEDIKDRLVLIYIG